MNTFDLERLATTLDKRELLRIRDGQGSGVAVLDGVVWVTQDGDPRDVFVGPGASFAFDRPGLAIVQALEPTRLFMLATT